MLSHSFARNKDSTDGYSSQCFIFGVLTAVSALIFDPFPYRNGSIASTDRNNNLNPSHAQVYNSSLGTADLIIYSLNHFCIFIVLYSANFFRASLKQTKVFLFFLYFSVYCVTEVLLAFILSHLKICV